MKLLLLLLVLPMIGFAQNVNIPNENDKKLEKPTEFDANKSDFNSDSVKNSLAGKSFADLLRTVDPNLGQIIDNFVRNTDITSANAGTLKGDLHDLSDLFKNSGLDMNDPAIKEFEDLLDSYAKTADSLDESSTKIKEIESEANIRANEKLLNAPLEELFQNDPQQLEIYRKLSSMIPSRRTKETLLEGLTESIIEINRTITEIKNGKLKGVNIVPISLQKLLDDLKENEKRVREFQIE